MKHLTAYKNDLVVFSGLVNVAKLDAEIKGNRTYLKIWNRDEFIGIVSCDRYEFE